MSLISKVAGMVHAKPVDLITIITLAWSLNFNADVAGLNHKEDKGRSRTSVLLVVDCLLWKYNQQLNAGLLQVQTESKSPVVKYGLVAFHSNLASIVARCCTAL